MTGPATLPRPVAPGRAAPPQPRPVADPLSAVLVAVDAVALAGAMAASGMLGWPGGCYGALVLVVLAGRGLYRRRICPRGSDQVPWLTGAAVLGLPALLPFDPAVAALLLAGWSAGLVVGCRCAVAAGLRVARAHGRLVRRTVLVGATPVGARIAELLVTRTEFGLRPLGVLADGPVDGPLPVLGPPAELPELAARSAVRQVIVCDPAADLVDVLHAVRGADVHVVPPLGELGMAVPRACLDEIWGIPLVPVRRSGPGRVVAKRLTDLVGATVLLVLLAPVLAALLAAVALTSGSPVLFRQLRLSDHGLVSVLKLRTLPQHADADTRWAVPDGGTPLGRLLRRTHADELPQLVNVLRGGMSLVGPRPERPYFAARFAERIPHYTGRRRMPAGITGWAQVHGLHGDTSMADRVRFDNAYIEYWTPWLDLVVLARTLASPWQRGGCR